MKQFWKRVFCGLVIGVGCVLPGVSGGIIAVSMGLYEGMLEAIGSFFSAVKKHVKFLLPIGIGALLGVLLTSTVLTAVLEQYESAVLALFAGLVLGSIPSLAVEAKGDPKEKVRYALAAGLGLAFILLFAFGEARVASNEAVPALNVGTALLSGAILSVGVVIPGISSSFLLIYLGLYRAVLTTIASVGNPAQFGAAFVPLVCLAAGFGVLSLLIIRGVNVVLKRWHALSYFAIIGFVVGSVAMVFPQILKDLTWYCPALFFVGLTASVFEGLLRARREAAKTAAAAPPAEPEKTA